MNVPLKRNAGLAVLALLASSSTLVCCVLPAVMVALGAGAALAGLITVIPQLIWLSEHKALVFGTAGGLLIATGLALWRSRRLPCPADPGVVRDRAVGVRIRCHIRLRCALVGVGLKAGGSWPRLRWGRTTVAIRE